MEKKLVQQYPHIRRVVLMGPESTGKSTLAKKLAEKFQTNHVCEHMRTYLEKKWEESKELCEENDLQPIVEGQVATENEAASTANQVIFCDTNALQNLIYAKEYYPDFHNKVVNYCVENHHYDLYLLCNIDVPWEEDILRDKPHEREKMFRIFVEWLEKLDINYHIVSGSISERMELTVPLVRELLK